MSSAASIGWSTLVPGSFAKASACGFSTQSLRSISRPTAFGRRLATIGFWPARSNTEPGILAWGTFGAINGAIIGAMTARSIGVAVPHIFLALWIGAASGAAVGVAHHSIETQRRAPGQFKSRRPRIAHPGLSGPGEIIGQAPIRSSLVEAGSPKDF
jgi:hypothetical protein